MSNSHSRVVPPSGRFRSLRFRCVSGPAPCAARRRPRGRRLRRRRRAAMPPPLRRSASTRRGPHRPHPSRRPLPPRPRRRARRRSSAPADQGRKIAPTTGPDRPAGRLRGHLLTADRMPALGEGLAWSVAVDRARDARPDRRLPEDVAARHRRGARRTPGLRRPRGVGRRGPSDRGPVRGPQVGLARRAGAPLVARRLRVAAGLPAQGGRPAGGGRDRAGRSPALPPDLRLEACRPTPPASASVREGAWLTIVEISADSDVYPTDWNPARRAVRRIATTFA